MANIFLLVARWKFGFASSKDAKSICESFLLIYPIIRAKKLQNIEFIYQSIETLSDFAQRMAELKDSYHEFMVKQFKDNTRETQDSATLEWDNSWKEITKINDALSSFRNFDLKKFNIITKDEDFDFIDSVSDT